MFIKDIIKEYSVRNKDQNDYPVYSVTNSQGFCRDYFGKEVASKDKSSYKIVPYGCFAYNPSRINVGSIDWQHCEQYVIVSPIYNVFEVNTTIARQDYLSYYFKSRIVHDYINTFAKGTVRLNVPLSTLGSFPIPVPPIAEQERIVAELDLLSGIIEKKKEQLKAYDQLAQSIFYTMFGDPIDNPKGWETKRLGDVCSLKAGKAIKAAELKEKTDDLYPCYGGNGIRGYIDKISHKEDLPIIGRQGALCGNVNFAKGPFYATEHAVVVTPLIEMNKIWLFHELKCSNLEQYAHGVAQPGIAVNDLNPITFPVPPLSLQEEFAEKVEAIERQKALVQQSIVETQTMFDCTMDKYFG